MKAARKSKNASLIVASPASMQKKIDAAVRGISAEKYSLVYLCINQSAKTVIEKMKKQKIATDKILFIDCISQNKNNDKNNVIFIENPKALTKTSIAINTALMHMPGKKAVIVDSLSTMMIYTELDQLARYTSSIIEKIRLNDAKTMMFAIPEKSLLNKVSPFFDEIIKE